MSIQDNNPFSPLLLDADTKISKPELEEKWSKTDTSKDKVVTSLEAKGDLSQFKTDNMTLKPSKLTSEKEFVKGAQSKAQLKEFRLKTPEKQPQKEQPKQQQGQVPKAPPLPNQQARQLTTRIESVEFGGQKYSLPPTHLEPIGKVSLVKSEDENIQDPKDFLEKRPINEARGSELRDVTQDIPDPINTDEDEETTPGEGNNSNTVQSYLEQSETEKEKLKEVLEKHNIHTHPVEPLDVDVEETVQNLNKKTTPVEDEFYNVKEEDLNTGLENKEEINPSPLIGTFNITKKPILHRNFDAEVEGASNPPVSENETIDRSQDSFPPLSENMEDFEPDEKPEWVEKK